MIKLRSFKFFLISTLRKIDNLWLLSTRLTIVLESFQGHSQTIRSVRLGSKSGRIMVSGGDDRRIHVWNLGNQTPVTTLIGHPHPVHSVSLDMSEELVCAGSSSGVIKIWDIEQAKVVRTLTGHKGSVSFLEFHPYGEFFVSASEDNSVKVWDIRKKSCIQSFSVDSATKSCIRISPDGKWVVHSNWDHGIKIWDLTAGKEIFSSNLFKRDFVGIDFHPHELILGIGTAEESIFLDLQTFRVVGESSMASSPQFLVKYSAPEMPLCLVSGCQDHLVVVNSCSGGEMSKNSSSSSSSSSSHRIPCPFVEVVDFQWVPNCNYLLTAMGDGLTIHSSLFDLTSLLGGIGSNIQIVEEDQERNTTSNSLVNNNNLVRQMWNLGFKDGISQDIPIIQPEKQSLTTSVATAFKRVNDGSSLSSKTDAKQDQSTPEGNTSIRISRRRASSSARKKSRYLPASGNNIIGLEPSVFNEISRDKNAPLKLQDRNLLSMAFNANNEEEMIEALKARHFNMLSTISLRLSNVKYLRTMMKNPSDKKTFLSVLSAIPSLNDSSVLIDVLRSVQGKPGLWTLEMFREVLPQISNILGTSPFEDYIVVCLETLKYLLKSFGSIIRETLLINPEIFHNAIDISHEERLQKCIDCNGLIADATLTLDHLKSVPSLKLLILDIQSSLDQYGLPLLAAT